MQFHPEEPFDRNKGQHAVWKALKAALDGFEGRAYYRLPIYSSGGFYRREIDVLVLLRDFGVFPLEVKGCSIGNIDAIDGNAWTMADWFRTTEAPCAQVDEQKFALLELLKRGGLTDVPCAERVVLPFVTSAAWANAGYANLASTQIVWTKEDLTPARMRAWLNSVPGRRRLSGKQWTRLESLFGADASQPSPGASAPLPSAPLSNATGSLHFLEFDGDPLSNAQLQGLIPELRDEHVSYSYIVATGALERVRSEMFHPDLQMVEPDDAEEAKPVLVFHKVLRHFVRQPNLRRFEERTLLLRAVREVAKDPTRRALLERDALAWREALVELDGAGFDLSRKIPQEVKDRLVREDLGDMLRDLQMGFREQMRRHGPERNFEWVGREFLDTVFRPTELVVLEGFSRFTPLQEHFLRRCIALGAHVVVVRPHRVDQQHGFEAIQAAHATATTGHKYVIQAAATAFSSSGDLRWLQQNLFAEAPTPPDAERDDSVVLEAWTHRNREVESAVNRVQMVMAEGCQAHDMAIVVRDPETYVPLILEEAELQGRPDLFRIPPRLLLLTPVGRFALGLYDVWDNGLHLEADVFETFLASGLLGARVQETADAFRGVKEQLFARCITRDEWNHRFADLHRLRQSLLPKSRIPAAGIAPEVVTLWKDVVDQLVGICGRLAQSESRPVGTHIRILLDELSKLDSAGMRQAEKHVIGQIRDVLTESTESASIELTPIEFGKVLLGMSQEREEFESEDSRRVSVVGAESLDGTRKRFVIALGVDDARVPRPPNESWPLADTDFEGHLQQERYLFLAMIRAASERIILSYAQTDGREERFSSMYLDEVAGSLGGINILGPRGSADATVASAEPSRPLGRARRKSYDLSELARFRLCPYRYKLERIDPTSCRYVSAFQLTFAAQGHWLGHALDWLANQGSTTASEPETAKEWFDNAFKRAQDSNLQDFPALRVANHAAIMQGMLQTRDYLVSHIVDKGYCAAIKRTPLQPLQVVVDGRPVTIATSVRHGLRLGSHLYPLLAEALSLEWLIHGTKPTDADEDGCAMEIVEGVNVNSHQYDVVKFWRSTLKTIYFSQYGTGEPFLTKNRTKLVEVRRDLAELIRTIEQGVYPKNPGDHCTYCPAFTTCLGKLP